MAEVKRGGLDSSSSSQNNLYCVLNEELRRPSHKPKGRLWSKQCCFLLMCGIVILFMALFITVCITLRHQYTQLTEVKNEVVNLTSSFDLLSSDQQDLSDRFLQMVGELKADLESRIANLTQHKPVLSCRAGWQLFLSNCYQFSSNTMVWEEARSYCSAQSALLLILGHDSREWDYIVHKAVSSSMSYWIGLTDAISGQWRWIDGSAYSMDSSQWEPGEPNNALGVEDCGELTASGKLNDVHCSTSFQFICKAPATSH